MELEELCNYSDSINELLARYGVKFGIYKNNTFKEQLFPFDVIPRLIGKEEFDYLERGLKQRVTALNLFIRDIYHEKKIIRDGVVPEEFVYAGSGYLAQCEGVLPPKGIYSHISGIDLVQGKDGSWYILEDNLRIPSGASYPMIARDLCRRCSPQTFRKHHVADNRNYAELLRGSMDYVNTGGHTVILTPGRYNAAYFEHSYLAEMTGAHLVTGRELTVENDRLYFVDYSGKKERVEMLDFDVCPHHFIRRSVDSFGNDSIYGCCREQHRQFLVQVRGIVTTDAARYLPAVGSQVPVFKYQTPPTEPGERLRAYHESLSPVQGGNLERAVTFMHRLHADFAYQQGVTGVDTTAEEAMALGRGVCQDYSHILLSLCRMERIPCRYVVGMMQGEGLSHAWVEVCDGARWVPLDPTNDLLVDGGYIRLSCGRDHRDCRLNQGIFTGSHGRAAQRQEISVIVEELP